MRFGLGILVIGVIGAASYFSLTKQQPQALRPTMSSVPLSSPSMDKNEPALTPSQIQKPSNKVLQDSPESFEKLLADLSPVEQATYLKLNNMVFGVLDFSTQAQFDKLKANGLPSLLDIDYVSSHSRGDIIEALMSEEGIANFATEHPSLNYHAVKMLNLVESISELTAVVNYYFPEYQLGEQLPARKFWPDGEYPEQYIAAINSSIWSFAITRETTALETLLHARYKQLIPNKQDDYAEQVVGYLAKASWQLGDHEVIEHYVAAQYPKHLLIYQGKLAEFLAKDTK
ncbi:hypothetical protein LP316_05000 [Thalassotalea sp. LPB0316]|uniref:hypothetical protein n=1 Tax=Thalassotalea sp. LPB0316 TaxID=2769490 RepID=UPI001867EF8C|nr:hypothetical protein [Thalassotalea sp. LPB0316]QOL26661.1 hypothetical protein LP316_05000 [Thalassotalea sp. LPB0316]